MAGLKSFLNVIASFSDEPFDALYERQRELMRCGLLPIRPGRGPGSGVPLTPETLATFLIGLLATDGLSDLARRTAQLSAAKPLLVGPRQKGKKDRRVNFHTAVAAALAESKIAGWQPGDDLTENECSGIQVTRHWRGMIMQFKTFQDEDNEPAEGVQGIDYIVSEEARLSSSWISRTASIEQEPWWFICWNLRSAIKKDQTAHPILAGSRASPGRVREPSSGSVVNLMDALRKGVSRDDSAKIGKLPKSGSRIPKPSKRNGDKNR